MEKSTKKIIMWSAISIVLIAAGYFGYKYYQKKKKDSVMPIASTPPLFNVTPVELKDNIVVPFNLNNGFAAAQL